MRDRHTVGELVGQIVADEALLVGRDHEGVEPVIVLAAGHLVILEPVGTVHRSDNLGVAFAVIRVVMGKGRRVAGRDAIHHTLNQVIDAIVT